MIEITHYSWEAGAYVPDLRPIGDSIPTKTWRKTESERTHIYPLRGCHGERLERPDLPDRKDIP